MLLPCRPKGCSRCGGDMFFDNGAYYCDLCGHEEGMFDPRISRERQSTQCVSPQLNSVIYTNDYRYNEVQGR